jgi:hypothetical protein
MRYSLPFNNDIFFLSDLSGAEERDHGGGRRQEGDSEAAQQGVGHGEQNGGREEGGRKKKRRKKYSLLVSAMQDFERIRERVRGKILYQNKSTREIRIVRDTKEKIREE